MTVARVRNPDYSGYFITAAKSPSAPRKVIRPKTLGINLIINPEVEVADEIMALLSSLYPTPVESFADGRVQIREFRVDKAVFADRPLTDISYSSGGTPSRATQKGSGNPPTTSGGVRSSITSTTLSQRWSTMSRCRGLPPNRALQLSAQSVRPCRKPKR